MHTREENPKLLHGIEILISHTEINKVFTTSLALIVLDVT